MKVRGWHSSRASGTCTSKSATRLAHLVHFVPDGTRDRNKYALGNTFAALHRHRFIAEIVDLHNQFVTFSTVVLVDDPYTLRDEQPLAARGTTAHRQQEHIAGWRLHNHIRRDEAQGAWRNLGVFAAEQVEAYRARRSIGGQRQAGVNAFDR